MKGLTDNQANVLFALELHGGFWHKDCGWFWKNTSSTERVMGELEKKGQVTSRDWDGAHRLFQIVENPPF